MSDKCFCSKHQDCYQGIKTGCAMCSLSEIANFRITVSELCTLVESQAATIERTRTAVKKIRGITSVNYEGLPTHQYQAALFDIRMVVDQVLALPSVEPEKSGGCSEDTCERDHSRGDHPIKDCDGCLGCNKFRLRVEPEKAEPCFKDMAGWCSTHTRDSSECEPEKGGESKI